MTVTRTTGLTRLAAALGGLAIAALALAVPVNAAEGPLSVTMPAPGVHVIGYTKAKLKVTEWVSYTCPHCSAFETDGGDKLRLFYLTSGKVKLEVRHLVRDPFDLTAAMLTNCGPAGKFDRNHAVFMKAQPTWLAKLMKTSPAQRARYTTGTMTQRRIAIATDAGFYPMMVTRGYSRVEVDRCLANETMAKALADATARYTDETGIRGTPSFAIDDVVLAGTYDWESLKLQVDARL